MSEPSREHVEAVGAFIDRMPAEAEMTPEYVTRPLSHSIASRLLASTDPAILTALRGVLVRAGWLHEVVEERCFVVMDDEHSGHWECEEARRRFESDWEDIER